MLVSELVSRVQVSLGDGGGVVAKNSFILSWMNEAIRDIFRKTNLGRDSQIPYTLVAGDNEYTNANEIFKVHYIAAADNQLSEMIYDNILEQYGWSYVNEPGTPKYFYRGYSNGQATIKFVPTPVADIDLKMSITFWPTELTLGDDTNEVIPSSYVDDIIRFCIMRGYERTKDFRASEKAESQYDQNLSIRISESNKLDDDYATIQPDPYDYM